MTEQKNIQWFYKLIFLIGVLQIIISIALFFLKDYRLAYMNSVDGVICILLGLFCKDAITPWKEMPKGMKIIVTILWFGFFSGLWSIYKNFEQTNFILGFSIQFPWSLLVNPLSLLIITLTLIGVYTKKWWKLILAIRGFLLINFLASIIFFLTMPITKLLALSGRDISNFTPDILEKIAFTAKLSIFMLMAVGLIIGIIIWIYIYKNKEYFSNQIKKTNQ